MVDIHTILNDYRNKKDNHVKKTGEIQLAPMIELPELFFDEVLTNHKFTRSDILVLFFLYRQVWIKPNVYKLHGVSPIVSHTEISKAMKLGLEEIYHSLRNLEESGFIEVFRTGQYFVRKYFTKELDLEYGQTYDNFEL